MIKFIFDPREESSGLAYGSLHCVPGLTLPPGDANHVFFSSTFSACLGLWRRIVNGCSLLSLVNWIVV